MTQDDVNKYNELISRINYLLFYSLEPNTQNIELKSNLEKVKKELEKRINNYKTTKNYGIRKI